MKRTLEKELMEDEEQMRKIRNDIKQELRMDQAVMYGIRAELKKECFNTAMKRVRNEALGEQKAAKTVPKKGSC